MQTVKIEIPIEAKDNTAGGVSSAERRLSGLERSMQKMQRQLDRMSDKHDINIDANDHASDKIDTVAGDLDKMSGTSADVSVDASVNDMATDAIHDVAAEADALDGTEAEADLDANDMATDVIRGAEAAADEFDSANAEADLEANDMATDVIQGAEAEAETFGGMSESATIGANDEASAVIENVQAKASDWGASAFTATIGVLGATVGVADTINTYKDFQSTMSEVEAISGASRAEMDALTESAKNYGSTTKFTATEAGEAFKYMAMAGWKVSDMQNGIGGILSLAAAAGEDLGTTSDIVTDALTAFNYKADQAGHFSDVLAAASSNSNTNVAMMGETFKYVGTMAGTLGYSIEDVALASGAMANAGLKSSMAGTSLNSILTRLSTNTNGARDAIEDLGVSFFKQDGTARPLVDVMNDLREATADMTPKMQSAFAETVAGTTAQKGLNAILNASTEDWAKLSDAIYNADGAAGKMADTMMNNLDGSITLFQSALEGVKDTLGERTEPYLRNAIDGLTSMLPGASEQITGFMNKFDHTVAAMTHSKEWKNADFLGKVNIAWDKVIAEPFGKWVSGKGKRAFSTGIADLFQDALKILPGGEEAGLTSWLSAGLVGIGATKMISGVGSLSSALTGLGASGSMLGGIGASLGAVVPYAAAATAALVAVGVAIDAINQKQINQSLSEHFGNISLTAEQAEAVASQILDAEWAVDIKLAVGQIEGAEEARKAAEEAIQDNKALEYKNSVGITLTADEQASYTSNIEKFIEGKVKELEGETYSAHIMVNTILGGTEEGQTLASAIESWTVSDTLEMSALSDQLRTAVDNALTDGIVSVDEAKHIAELQQAINDITNKWKEAESQASMDVIRQKYGKMSGKDLDSDSYGSVIESLRGQREENSAYLDEASQSYYTMLHAMENSGRLSEVGLDFDTMSSLWANAVKNREASSLANSVNFETETLNGTYGDRIKDNRAKNAEAAVTGADYLSRNYEQGAGNEFLFNAMETQVGNMSRSGDKALTGLYAQMKPDVNAMGDLIDSYRETGQAIPKALMSSYNEAMEVGAASGDIDAAWAVYANQLKESGNKALVSGILDGSISAPEEMRTALERAMSEVTDDPIDLDSVTAKLNGPAELENMDEVAQSIKDQIGESGTVTAETEADVTVTVNEETALSSLAESLGVTEDKLAEYNGLSEGVTLEQGAEVRIPRELVTTDTSGLDAALAEDPATPEAKTVEQEYTVNQTMNDGEVTDNTTAAEAPEEQTTTQTTTVNENYVLGTSNESEIYAEAGSNLQDTFNTNFPVNGNVDVTLSRASDNIGEIYSAVGSDITSQFAAGFSASAPVRVTLSYSITNPTASISLGGSASGSGTVTASIAGNATGNYIDSKVLSWLGEEGPEYVIPTTGRYKSRGQELWMAAGVDLGMFDGVSANADGTYYDGNQEVDNPFAKKDQNIWTTAGTPQESVADNGGESKPVSVVNSGESNKVDVNVTMQPTIQIEGSNMDEQKIFEVIQSRIRELCDDVADEIATQMAKSFDNMPLTQGV